uniref:Pecanex-like protein n=1 Tax=Echinostoma caproni TaxID=27848 RepID=A0A183B9M8_9TREM
LRACGLAFEMRSDMGSIRSYQPSEVETIPLMQQMLAQGGPTGGYDPRNGGLTPTRSPRNLSLVEGDYGLVGQGQHRLSHTSSHGTNMTMLSNRVITEAYLAAARAASEAVAASVVSGSTDLYSPSTQLTSDLSSLMAENGTDGEKDPGRTGASNNHRHSHPAEGNESTVTMGPKAVKANARKSSDPVKIRQGVRSPNSSEF